MPHSVVTAKGPHCLRKRSFYKLQNTEEREYRCRHHRPICVDTDVWARITEAVCHTAVQFKAVATCLFRQRRREFGRTMAGRLCTGSCTFNGNTGARDEFRSQLCRAPHENDTVYFIEHTREARQPWPLLRCPYLLVSSQVSNTWRVRAHVRSGLPCTRRSSNNLLVSRKL